MQFVNYSKYIQILEQTSESISSSKYVIITTNTDNANNKEKVNQIVKCFYSDRQTINRERQSKPIMYTVVSSYTQALANFHQALTQINPDSKRLKVQFNDHILTTKHTSI